MLKEIESIFRIVFKNKSLQITVNTAPNEFEMWDSLTHLELITAIEEKYAITFAYTEVLEMVNVDSIIKLIQSKQYK